MCVRERERELERGGFSEWRIAVAVVAAATGHFRPSPPPPTPLLSKRKGGGEGEGALSNVVVAAASGIAPCLPPPLSIPPPTLLLSLPSSSSTCPHTPKKLACLLPSFSLSLSPSSPFSKASASFLIAGPYSSSSPLNQTPRKKKEEGGG